MKLRFYLYFLLSSISLVAQKDAFHTFIVNGQNDGKMNIKSVDDSTALIFVFEDYSAIEPASYGTMLTKVDYCGEIIDIGKANVDGFSNVLLLDGHKFDNSFILAGTAINETDHLPYFVIVSANLELTHFEVIDSRKINFPAISSIDVFSSKDEVTEINNLVINISGNFFSVREAVFISYTDEGNILYLQPLVLDDNFVYDYYYNHEIKRHFIFSGSIITVLNEDREIIHTYDIYVKLNDIKYYNFEYKFLYADDKIVSLVGSWIARRELYTFKVELDGDSFKPGEYNDHVFPKKRYYDFRKHIGKENKIIISSSTDILDTTNDVPNETFFWEFDKDGNILKTYIIPHNSKVNLGLRSIDSHGNLLGLGYEYANDRNFFVILGENNGYLSNVENADDGWKDLLVYPNPASDEIFIKSETNLTSVKIYDIFGREVICSMHLQPNSISINIRNLAAGSYHILINDGNLSTHKQFIKM